MISEKEKECKIEELTQRVTEKTVFRRAGEILL
jgi:hypothetical protein